MSTAFLRRVARPGVLAAVVVAGLGIPAHAGAAATETETVNRTVAFTPGATLTVRNFSGRVTITGSDRRDVSVQAVRRAPRERLERITLDVRADGGGAVVEANSQAEPRQHDENVVETDLTIEVPREANLDVETFSSPVIVHDVTGSRHRVKTFSGDQQLQGVTGPVDAEAFSGSIDMAPTWKDGNKLDLHTFSGHIEVQVPPSAAASVEFDTFSGDFASDLPLTVRTREKRSMRADLAGNGSAAGLVRMHTFSGDARVRK